MSDNYDATKITALKGLDPVKKLPGMYTRTESPTHIIQEGLDNAVDEALGGYADQVSIKMYADGSASIIDNGRGIPVDIHPDEGIPAVQVIFTILHSGGKFDKSDDSSYQFSGGLHGVGVSVLNALSTRLEVRIKKKGFVHGIAFEHGDVVEPLSQLEACGEDKGTEIRAWPSPDYFDSPNIDKKEIRKLLHSKAVLLNGVKFTYMEEDGKGEWSEENWQYEDGISQYLSEAIPEEKWLSPICAESIFMEETVGDVIKGEGSAWALVWAEGPPTITESYVNLIPTIQGGTHVNGLRSGIVEAVRTFADQHSMLPRGIKLSTEDIWGQVNYVLSAKLCDVQFQGQTKEKLNNRQAVRFISKISMSAFEQWLHTHLEEGKAIVEIAIRAAEKRMRSAKKVERKSSSGAGVLPGKLTDCLSSILEERELFLVEGDSAGGSAKGGRDKERQAVLPLRGKILNTWETDPDKLFDNNEVHDISEAIGVAPHAHDDKNVDLSGLRYQRISILADADVDGHHIECLLIALFTKHFYQLIKNENIWVCIPPLYRIDAFNFKALKRQKIYVQDDDEKLRVMARLGREGYPVDKINIQRFKGLGEMSPELLWDTTLNPESRIMLPLLPDAGMDVETYELLNDLLSKKTPHKRCEFLEEFGNQVELN